MVGYCSFTLVLTRSSVCFAASSTQRSRVSLSTTVIDSARTETSRGLTEVY